MPIIHTCPECLFIHLFQVLSTQMIVITSDKNRYSRYRLFRQILFINSNRHTTQYTFPIFRLFWNKECLLYKSNSNIEKSLKRKVTVCTTHTLILIHKVFHNSMTNHCFPSTSLPPQPESVSFHVFALEPPSKLINKYMFIKSLSIKPTLPFSLFKVTCIYCKG